MKHIWPAAAQDPVDKSSEEKLVRKAVRGHEDAFGQLYILYLDAIYRYVYYRTDNAAVAEDLTENIFFKAWQAIAGYEQQGIRFSSWLYRIARNTVIDHYRTREEDLPLTGDPPMVAEGEGLGPEEVLLRTEEVNRLQDAISRLPEEQQQVVILRFLEGLSHAQVGEILNKSEGACRVIQHRALVALGRLLDELE